MDTLKGPYSHYYFLKMNYLLSAYNLGNVQSESVIIRISVENDKGMRRKLSFPMIFRTFGGRNFLLNMCLVEYSKYPRGVNVFR